VIVCLLQSGTGRTVRSFITFDNSAKSVSKPGERRSKIHHSQNFSPNPSQSKHPPPPQCKRDSHGKHSRHPIHCPCSLASSRHTLRPGEQTPSLYMSPLRLIARCTGFCIRISQSITFASRSIRCCVCGVEAVAYRVARQKS
jgi:hypothetical protein